LNSLLLFNETFTKGLTYSVINIISVLSIFCGIFVIISKNPIVSVLFLIGLFVNIAGYLMILGMNYIGLSYLLVYVGAVSILFLFILMLINVRISELVSDNSNSIPLAVIIGIFFFITYYKLLHFYITLPKDFFFQKKSENIIGDDNFTSIISYLLNENNLFYKNSLSYVTSKFWDGVMTEWSHITSIGNVIYTVYPLWLIITSLILLLAMVGAIIITIKK